ncbi:MAG: ATP-binding cassette domain-containing protein, partial [Planctomycetota bacterium]
MIEVQNITKRYDGTIALDDVSHEFKSGKTTVLIGPSGCGKSTLLRALIGLVTPESGEIQFDGKQVTRDSLPALRLKMGYLIQEGGLFPHLSCRENVSLVAEQEQIADIDQQITKLRELVRLDASLLD